MPRCAVLMVAAIAGLLVAGCAQAAVPRASSPATSAGPAESAGPAVTPTPAASASPDAGNVDGRRPGPELTIELPGPDRIDVTLDDPAATAWRVVVAGRGELAGDRLELVVESTDGYPLITATEVRNGAVVDTMDLSGHLDGTSAAGGCHATLAVCVDSSWFHLPDAGDGRFAIRLQLPGPRVPLLVTGATAAWPEEPFVLGPWTETEPFPWGGE